MNKESQTYYTPESQQTQETQQFETQDILQLEDESEEKSSDHWGSLLQIKGTRLEFSDPEKVYTVGSGPTNSIVIKESGISRVHFEIKRDKGERSSIAIIKDTSSNGTYLNGKKIGKNKEFPLTQYDTITILHPPISTFRFLDFSRLKQNQDNSEHEEILKSYTFIEDLG